MEKQKNIEREYFLGLDIGTDSVGYAAADENYGLLKFHGEPMWGVTLFDEAQLNQERRTFRTARRRLDRRQQRVDLLGELFASEIAAVDAKFFLRMQESALYRSDTDSEYTIFDDETYTDVEYHRNYPTIHHLICELMTSDKPHDVRLVYLACAWLVAHRGHFLSTVSAEHIDQLTDFGTVYQELTESLFSISNDSPLPWRRDCQDELGTLLKKKITVTGKYKAVSALLFPESKVPKETDNYPVNCEIFWKALCGSKISAKDLFGAEAYTELASFSLNSDDDVLFPILAEMEDDHAALLLRMKAVFDWSLLANALENSKSISESKVKIYERHKADLRILKYIIRKYAPEKYAEIFRQVVPDNYVSYSGHCKDAQKSKVKSSNPEKFSKYLLKIVNTITPDDADQDAFRDMKNRLELLAFLPKQKNTDNRVIPHQLYQWELNEILRRAEGYLPFLSVRDSGGLSVSDKIRSVFTFRIPYFVGPLNVHSDKAWVKFKSETHSRILPWNFDSQIDEDACEEEFIRRMTNTCSYLPGEKVLPKDSLLYHRFTVLNEINNLKIDGQPISVADKQKIYTELFSEQRKVTRKKLEGFMICNHIMEKGQSVSGIDEQIKSDLKPQHDFHRLLSSGILSEEQAERIIERSTYAEDKNRFTKWLRKEYSFLADNDIAYLSKLKYKDFGRLSGRFLCDLEGCSKKSGTGEAFSIIGMMWNTNLNLMELLSDEYTFKENIEIIQKEYYSGKTMTLTDRLDEMYISNAVKRPVIRTLEIVKEVVRAVGGHPAKIFVEMTRGATEDQKNKRTKTRKEQILELYEKCKGEDIRLLREQLDAMGEAADNRLQGDRLFLYFMQLGKCMYSGRPIDIERIKGDTYNIEHIYPRAFVKDDSIINNEILVESELNGQKSDTYPISEEIRHSMFGIWKYYHDIGLISDEKYKRLTRATPFTDDEKLGFINRQLTETSQSAKAVAELLKERYPDTEIVYVKARLASEFRQAFDLLKSRTFNDLHHAKDAYLNIVTGNVYDMKFSKRWFDVKREYSMKTEVLFTRPVVCGGKTVWDGKEMLDTVMKTVQKNNAHLTRYAFCRHGGFFDQMPVKAAEGLIPLKNGLPTEQYGGYNRPAVSFFLLTKYRSGKKAEVMVLPVEHLCGNEVLSGEIGAADYAKRKIQAITGKPVDEVSFPLGLRIIKINTVLSLDGFKVCIAGNAGGGRCIIPAPLMSFSADRNTETYLKRLEMFAEKKQKNPGYIYSAEYDKITAAENLSMYDLYLSKLENSIYGKRPNNQSEALKKGRTAFTALDIPQQVKTLLAIHQIFGRMAGGCDLTAIGSVAHAAATVSFSSSLSNWKKQYTDVRIIDSSASGLWEKQSENLLDLL